MAAVRRSMRLPQCQCSTSARGWIQSRIWPLEPTLRDQQGGPTPLAIVCPSLRALSRSTIDPVNAT